MNSIIEVSGLSKQYRIGTKEPYYTLRDTLMNAIKSPARLFNRRGTSDDNTIWALKDISFEINQGERIGIIGRNGAGKTTLLKILSRITEPTKGRVTMRGRVASLLEVGTGFHPELTGRENIFLNGAILGMSKTEIRKKFDEIVAFAEIEKFLDTPVKRYSSGMYVRLAFAVAAHLEPEILLVDEVLAVGDVQFQKKCLGKMDSVSKEGRTVLFVSHQMEAIENLCSKTILLDQGAILEAGSSQKVIEHYLDLYRKSDGSLLRDRKDRTGEGRLKFTDTWIENKNGKRTTVVQSGDPLTIVAQYEVLDGEKVSNVGVAFGLYGKNGIPLADLSNLATGDLFHGHVPERGQFRCNIPHLPLNSGTYTYNVFVSSGMVVEDHLLNAGYFEVEASDYFGTGKIANKRSIFFVENKWKLQPDTE